MVEITWKFSYGSNGMKACNRREKTSYGIAVSVKSVKTVKVSFCESVKGYLLYITTY